MFDIRGKAGAAVAAASLAAVLCATTAVAQTTIRVQSVIPATADEVVMLKDFGADVAALTNGEVIIEGLSWASRRHWMPWMWA